MAWVAVSCPQCSAPLPRVAIWRAVKCPACGSLITRAEDCVKRDAFRQGLNRARLFASAAAGSEVLCGGERYALLQSLGRGTASEVFLARRLGQMPLLGIRQFWPRSEVVVCKCRSDKLRPLCLQMTLRSPSSATSLDVFLFPKLNGRLCSTSLSAVA